MIALTLPLPPAALSPNARGHWAAKARATKAYRHRAEMTARANVPAHRRERWPAAEVRWTWYFPDRRRRDPDNIAAACKALWDGLRDAGIIADDDRLVIHPPTVAVDRERPRIEMVITECEER